MNKNRTMEQEAAEDVFFGQVVINWARWFVIAAAAVMIVGSSTDTFELVLGIVPVVGLMALNFYLHGRRLAERPANRGMIGLASLVDVGLITLAILVWPVASGLSSEFYVLYYPLVLALAFVMPPRVTLAYTGLVMAAYAVAVFVGFAFDGNIPLDLGNAADVSAWKQLMVRLITLAAAGGLGAYYYRKQRERRRESAVAPSGATL